MCEDERYWPSVKIVSTTLKDSSVGRVPAETRWWRQFESDSFNNKMVFFIRIRIGYISFAFIFMCLFFSLLLPVKIGWDFGWNYSLFKYKRSFAKIFFSFHKINSVLHPNLWKPGWIFLTRGAGWTVRLLYAGPNPALLTTIDHIFNILLVERKRELAFKAFSRSF